MKKIKKITLAPQDKVKKLEPQIAKILKGLGHPEALVTDESIVADFIDIFDKEQRIRQIQKTRKKIGVHLFPGDFLWEVAERIVNAKNKHV